MAYQRVKDGVYIYRRFDKNYPASRGVYHLYVSYEKQTLRRSLKTTDHQLALERALAKYTEIQKRILLNQGWESASFNELCDEYLRVRKLDKESRQSDYDEDKDYHKLIIDTYLKPFFGKHITDVNRIPKTKLAEYLEWRLHQVKDRTGKRRKVPIGKTLNRERSVFVALMEFAVDKGWLSKDALPNMKWQREPAEDDQPHVAFSTYAYNSLHNKARANWKQIENDPTRTARQKELSYLLWEYILFAANTGVRPGKETRDIKWKHIDFRYNTLRIERGKVRTRIIPLFPQAVTVLERLKARENEFAATNGISFDENAPVWRLLADDKPIHNFSKEFKALLKSGVKGLEHDVSRYTPYSLRHTFATFGLQRGVSAELLMKHMGTSVRPFYKAYNQLQPVYMREELEQKLGPNRTTQANSTAS